MNHDATHCSDYEKQKCPNSCYRARLTEDLAQRGDLVGIPMSWASFRYSEECPFCTLPRGRKKEVS